MNLGNQSAKRAEGEEWKPKLWRTLQELWRTLAALVQAVLLSTGWKDNITVNICPPSLLPSVCPPVCVSVDLTSGGEDLTVVEAPPPLRHRQGHDRHCKLGPQGELHEGI